MKKYFAVAGIFAALCFTTFNGNAQNYCTDTCDFSKTANNYCAKDKVNLEGTDNVSTADTRIDTFAVTKDDAGHLLLKVHVKNTGNNNAWNTRLVILLPIDVCNIMVKNDMRPSSIPYNQCGGRIEFCLGNLGNGKTFSVTIQTDTAKLATRKGQESFAGFVYSSTPDKCPHNNYRAWINEGVICSNINTATLVEKGAIH